jgi:hypothetical protein
MDDLSINGPLPSATPIKEVGARNSSGGDQPRSRKRAYEPETQEEDEVTAEDEHPHAVDEQV